MNGVAFYYPDSTYGTTVNLYDEYGLMMVDKIIEPPEVQTYVVEIPGRNGLLDLTEALTGAPVFKNRKITMEFRIKSDVSSWPDLYSDLLRVFHGQQLGIIFDDDPDFYYYGRIIIDPMTVLGINFSGIKISADCEPYKQRKDWKWIETETSYVSKKENDDGSYRYEIPGKVLLLTGASAYDAKYIVSCTIKPSEGGDAGISLAHVPLVVNVHEYGKSDIIDTLVGEMMPYTNYQPTLSKGAAKSNGLLTNGVRYEFYCKPAVLNRGSFGIITVTWKLYKLEAKL